MIKKGDKLNVRHSRKGAFLAIAERDFDETTEEIYPLVSAQYVEGTNTDWVEGESIPCRASLCSITPA